MCKRRWAEERQGLGRPDGELDEKLKVSLGGLGCVCVDGILSAVWAIIDNYTGHDYIGHDYIGRNYIGHNCIGHNYIGHNYLGHNYIGPQYR